MAMRRSIQGMLEELEGNLWEHILMRVVDYGHTFSPEIEMAALHGDTPMLLHGEAVNVDMAITTQVDAWHTADHAQPVSEVHMVTVLHWMHVLHLGPQAARIRLIRSCQLQSDSCPAHYMSR